MLEDLHIYEKPYGPGWQELQDNVENVIWLELLRPFASVKNPLPM
jgi:hypothetical protein